MNIYNHARQVNKKPSADKVADIIKDLYATAASDVERDALATIFKYFDKPIKKVKTPFDWLMTVVSKEEARPYLHMPYSNGNRVAACNGHILFIWPKAGLPVDFLNADMSASGKVGNWVFPDIDRVIPAVDKSKIVTGMTIGKNGRYQISEYDSYSFDTALMDKALALGGEYTMQWDGTKDPMRIDFADGRIAVIMPMRVAP